MSPWSLRPRWLHPPFIAEGWKRLDDYRDAHAIASHWTPLGQLSSARLMRQCGFDVSLRVRR